MTTSLVLNIIGWVALVASWVAPRFIKEELSKSFWGGALSAFALGVFVSGLVIGLMK